MKEGFGTAHFSFVNYTAVSDALNRTVWATRNHPDIRKWMVNTHEIPFEEHLKFVASLRNATDRVYYAALSGDEFIGAVNLTFTGGASAERGLYLNPAYFGKGYAKLICSEIYDYFRKNIGLAEITTKVKTDNIPSNALERSLGAVLESKDCQYNYYRLKL